MSRPCCRWSLLPWVLVGRLWPAPSHLPSCLLFPEKKIVSQVWNSTFLGHSTTAILPYQQALQVLTLPGAQLAMTAMLAGWVVAERCAAGTVRSSCLWPARAGLQCTHPCLPASPSCALPRPLLSQHFAPHIQQLSMESNGKGVAIDGTRLPYETGARTALEFCSSPAAGQAAAPALSWAAGSSWLAMVPSHSLAPQHPIVTLLLLSQICFWQARSTSASSRRRSAASPASTQFHCSRTQGRRASSRA